MEELIEDLLEMSKISRAGLKIGKVDISKLAESILIDLREREPMRKVEATVESGMTGIGDANLLKIVFENLLGNAWKFTSKKNNAHISAGIKNAEDKTTFYVSDNGVGFDMEYATKLFSPFQRLHSMDEFPGTGVGLATVKRIIAKHNGKIWVQAEQEKGATFFFTLG
jgi:light-regulated signal transduction histidine kinase (bacteriophytochrome)